MDLYLVDFENVQKDGLKGISKAFPGAQVAVFYSGSSKVMDRIEELKKLYPECSIELFYHHKIHKNYADFQICTYLGYFIEHYKKDLGRICIVSRDTGFDSVIDFWSEAGVAVIRQDSIAGKQRYYGGSTCKESDDASDIISKMKSVKASSLPKYPKQGKKAIHRLTAKDGLSTQDYELIYKAAKLFRNIEDFKRALDYSMPDGLGPKIYTEVAPVYRKYRSNYF